MRITRSGGPTVDLRIGGSRIEEVDTFKYLGSLITNDGRCWKEIRTRLAIANQVATCH